MNTGSTQISVNMTPGFKNIEEYILTFPPETQFMLEQIRATIRNAAPGATEAISYQMPAFKLGGKALVYFAGYKNHIGFYPVPSGMNAFKKELSAYKQGKGSVQFPLDKPLSLDLVAEIVKFRVLENLEKAKTR